MGLCNLLPLVEVSGGHSIPPVQEVLRECLGHSLPKAPGRLALALWGTPRQPNLKMLELRGGVLRGPDFGSGTIQTVLVTDPKAAKHETNQPTI